MKQNPFKVHSPEGMSAQQVASLFVPVAEGFDISGREHVFIHGHRGCGKSMLLRYMAPDCQIIEHKTTLQNLPYLGIYATIKTAGLDVAEYERLNSEYAGNTLAEHSLVSFLGSKVFDSLHDHCLPAIEGQANAEELKSFGRIHVLRRLAQAGVEVDAKVLDSASSVAEVLRTLSSTLDAVYGQVSAYLRRSAFSSDYQPYQGPLLAYRDFLFPLFAELTSLSFLPNGKPVYYLIDDADNLNSFQTRVLNTWISFRTGSQVSFKVSTQLAYKTAFTTSKQRIESPHDFREIHVSSIHTGSSSTYLAWVRKVVQKRLIQAGVEASAEDFFPEDGAQEAQIRAIAAEIRVESEKNPRGYRAADDVYRYARPEYIKRLGGTSKQQQRYKYAGFQQLVHISSGIIRYFLDNAAQMYAHEEQKADASSPGSSGEVESIIAAIAPTVQDAVVRGDSDGFMLDGLDRLETDAGENEEGEAIGSYRKLRNLVRALGGIFYEILISDRTERRVFSVALSDDPPDEVMHTIRLGVQNGYFYEAAIGAKEGRWRTRRYIMTRRLAPHFKLDPSGFSGYLFVTTELLARAMSNPRAAIDGFVKGRLGTVVEQGRLPFDFEEGSSD